MIEHMAKKSDMAIADEKIKANSKSGLSTRKLRFFAQLFSMAVSVWIGVEFYLFVKYLENGGIGAAPTRPPGVEGYLPLSGLISLRDWLITGTLNTIHPASLIILLAIVTIAFLFKKAFCGWVCPVGFISELIGTIGDKIINGIATIFGGKKRRPLSKSFIRLKLPVWLDYPLRSLKYILLGFFGYAIFWSMTNADIISFVDSPYNKVADIKMLKFFTNIDAFALWTIVILFGLSIILRGFWCRYLCPYGGLLGLLSLLGPAKIKRHEDICISCGKCAKACPSFIKVDEIKQVRSDECSGCLDCLDVCPVPASLDLQMAPSKKRINKKYWALAVIIVFWGMLFAFKLFGPWQNSITTEEYLHHAEQMNGAEYTHPGRR